MTYTYMAAPDPARKFMTTVKMLHDTHNPDAPVELTPQLQLQLQEVLDVALLWPHAQYKPFQFEALRSKHIEKVKAGTSYYGFEAVLATVDVVQREQEKTKATSSKKAKSDKKCYFCGIPGHIESQCRKKKNAKNATH